MTITEVVTSRQEVDRREFQLRGRLDGVRLAYELAEEGASVRHAAQLSQIELLKASLTAAQYKLLHQKYERVRYASWAGGGALDSRCLLFNVIVALEWIPGFYELEQLRSACDTFANLLFDATDGYMTVGRVIVGGPELMAWADIQVFASNRLHPRAWVDGMHIERKYQPIRIGRGMWNKLEGRLYAWHQKDGPAVLAHEWAHYALGLKDQYLKPRDVGGLKLVLPERNPIAHTLMANLLSNELLSTRLEGAAPTEWDGLRTNEEFGWLGIADDHTAEHIPPDESPQPAFRLVGRARKFAPLLWMRWDRAGDLDSYVGREHCWLYVLKGSLEAPQQLIAQGVFEDRADGFPLLGAAVGDYLIAVGTQGAGDERAEAVAYAQITADAGPRVASFTPWRPATPSAQPLVTVRGELLAHSAEPRSVYRLRVEPGPAQGWAQHVFPFDNTYPISVDPATLGAPAVDPEAGGHYDTVALDGHVLLTRQEEGRWQLAIATFSLGGSPPAAFPAHANPIPAGSADGNAMIFFNDAAGGMLSNVQVAMSRRAEPASPYERLRIVTATNVHAGPAVVAAPAGASLGPRSYSFSVTTSQSLADTTLRMAELSPTLVLYVDEKSLTTTVDPAPERELKICRLEDGAWLPLDESRHVGADYVIAIPLDATTAPGLYAKAPRPEHYRVFLMRKEVPHSSPEPEAQASA